MMKFGMRASGAKLLALAAMLSTVTACGEPVPLSTAYPPVEDVKVEPQPVPGPEVFESEEAANLYDSAYTAWAERGWAAVGRICRDAARKGAPYPAGWCPPAPVVPE